MPARSTADSSSVFLVEGFGEVLTGTGAAFGSAGSVRAALGLVAGVALTTTAGCFWAAGFVEGLEEG